MIDDCFPTLESLMSELDDDLAERNCLAYRDLLSVGDYYLVDDCWLPLDYVTEQ